MKPTLRHLSVADVDAALSVITKSFTRGLMNALDIHALGPLLSSDRSILLNFLKVAGANIFLIVGSDLVVLQRCLLPLCRRYGCFVYGYEFGPPAYQENHLPTWVEYMATSFFYSVWLFPVWMLIYAAVNIPTYAELARLMRDRRVRLSQKDATGTKASAESHVPSTAEEETYRHLFFAFLLVQKYFLLALPSIASFFITVVSGVILYSGDNVSGTGIAEITARWHWPWTETHESMRREIESVDIGGLFTTTPTRLAGALSCGATLCAVLGGASLRALGLAFSMLLNSLYAFEYAWAASNSSSSSSSSTARPTHPSTLSSSSASAPARHARVEQSWPYFLGFGLPVTLLSSALVQYWGGGLFAALGLSSTLFPLTQVQAAGSTALQGAADAHRKCLAYVPRLPLFAPSYTLVENMAVRLFSVVRGKKETHFAQARERANFHEREKHQKQVEEEEKVEARRQQVSTHSSSSSSSSMSSSSTSRKLTSPPPNLVDDLVRGRVEAAVRENAAGVSRRTAQVTGPNGYSPDCTGR